MLGCSPTLEKPLGLLRLRLQLRFRIRGLKLGLWRGGFRIEA